MSRRTRLLVLLVCQTARAQSSASISSLYKIASALDVPIAALFGAGDDAFRICIEQPVDRTFRRPLGEL